MSEEHPEQPGNRPDVPPGQEDQPGNRPEVPPGQEDQPDKPDEPDVDDPHPAHPIVEPEPTPHQAEVEPRLSLEEFATVVTLRPPAVATMAALESYMRRITKEPGGYLTTAEWHERYQAMLTHVA